jgi:ATP-binding cassette subfamily F protein 3
VAKSKKAGWSGTADKTNPFMLLERRLIKEKEELVARMQRPDFWIDQESVDELSDKVVDKYDRYKAKNIRLGMGGAHRFRRLIKAEDLSLGYDHPLFGGVSFELSVGERLRLHGRNGAGKSTLISYLLSSVAGQPSVAQVYSGTITADPRTVIGVYDQEIGHEYLELPLGEAIVRAYREVDRPINDQLVRQVLSQYLFDPRQDILLPIKRLSGGQKARFQMIALLANEPNLLILDEPTNHLDLPSIEELEKALEQYQGAVLYVSHDSYFSEKVGGEVVELKVTKH